MDQARNDIPWTTIPAMLADNCARFARREALIDGDVRLNYDQLLRCVGGAAAGLERLGIGGGDRVAIWGANSWQWAVAALASWWRGCVVVPIDARSRWLDSQPVLEQVAARLVFADPALPGVPALLKSIEQAQASAGIPPLVEHVVSLSDTAKEASPTWQSWSELVTGDRQGTTMHAAVQAEDICEILYTSGSSGTPKGVIRQHYQVITNRLLNARRRGFCRDDILLGLPPFSHTLGLNGTLLRALMLGACVVISRSSNPRDIAALATRNRVTALTGPPSLFESLFAIGSEGREMCGRLRLVSIGSATIPPELIAGLLDAGVESIASGYGMTECDSIASATSDMGVDAVVNTVGTPDPGIEIKIMTDSDSEAEAGEPGEIWVRGYTTSPGYYLSPAEDARLYAGDNWMRTGDIGCRTPAGYLKILGRKKEVISSHGYKVYPAEVEQLMMKSGMLRAVAVLGVRHRLAGEQCVAFVVPLDASSYDKRALQSWTRTHIADYKIPTRLYQLDELPLNRAGKVDRLALRDRHETHAHG